MIRIGVLWHGANVEQEAIYLAALRQGLQHDLHGEFVSDIGEEGLSFVAIFPIENLSVILQPSPMDEIALVPRTIEA